MHTAEVASFKYLPGFCWAFGWVGERRIAGEVAVETSGGRYTSENAGMSSE